MTKRDRRHLWAVPEPSGSDEESEPPEEPDDPAPPDEHVCVLLW